MWAAPCWHWLLTGWWSAGVRLPGLCLHHWLCSPLTGWWLQPQHKPFPAPAPRVPLAHASHKAAHSGGGLGGDSAPLGQGGFHPLRSAQRVLRAGGCLALAPPPLGQCPLSHCGPAWRQSVSWESPPGGSCPLSPFSGQRRCVWLPAPSPGPGTAYPPSVHYTGRIRGTEREVRTLWGQRAMRRRV